MSSIEKALAKAEAENQELLDKLSVASVATDSVLTADLVSDADVNKPPHLESIDKVYFSNQSTPGALTIDWKSLANNGFLCADNAKSELAEEFRVIKRPLINNAFGAGRVGINRSNLILICSGLPGEGKTYVSINLALSIANERDKNVLLIDADVEKPSLSKTLGADVSPGLIEFLEDPKLSFTDILRKTDLPNLSLIPAGRRHRYSTELLASERMVQFAEEVSRRYSDRIVIFDSPPLLVATQAQVLSELVGQVVLVVAADSTLQQVVVNAAAKLKSCDVVLTLLNKSKKGLDSYGYGYGYGQYGH